MAEEGSGVVVVGDVVVVAVVVVDVVVAVDDGVVFGVVVGCGVVVVVGTVLVVRGSAVVLLVEMTDVSRDLEGMWWSKGVGVTGRVSVD